MGNPLERNRRAGDPAKSLEAKADTGLEESAFLIESLIPCRLPGTKIPPASAEAVQREFLHDETSVLIIMGPTGSGKSTLTGQIVFDAAKAPFGNPDVMPIKLKISAYDRYRDKLSQETQKPTTAFGEEESQEIDRRIIQLVTKHVPRLSTRPQKEENRQARLKAICEVPGIMDSIRKVDRGIDAARELVRVYGFGVQIIFLIPFPEIMEETKATRTDAIEASLGLFSPEKHRIHVVGEGSRRKANKRLQQHMQKSGSPDSVEPNFDRWIDFINEELNETADEDILRVQLPEICNTLGEETQLKYKMILYYLAYVLRNQIGIKLTNFHVFINPPIDTVIQPDVATMLQ